MKNKFSYIILVFNIFGIVGVGEFFKIFPRIFIFRGVEYFTNISTMADDSIRSIGGFIILLTITVLPLFLSVLFIKKRRNIISYINLGIGIINTILLSPVTIYMGIFVFAPILDYIF